MATPRYLPVDTFQSWARDEIAGDAGLVEQAINAAEELLDHEAKRSLVLVDDDTTATPRVFAPDYATDVIWISDAAEVTTVVENGTTLAAGTDYQLEPLNQIDPETGAYRPYDRVRRLDAYWYHYGHRATVTVTAKWGWESIPAVVVEACKVLAADWLEHRNVRLGVIAATVDGFSIGVRSSPAVQQAIETIAGSKPLSVRSA